MLLRNSIPGMLLAFALAACATEGAPDAALGRDAGDTADASALGANSSAQPHGTSGSANPGGSDTANSPADTVTAMVTSAATGSVTAPGGTHQDPDAATSADGGSAAPPLPDAGNGLVNGQGGTVAGEDSQVVIPAGALDGTIQIVIEPGSDVAEDGEWTYSPAGNPVRFGPSGTTFSEPVAVTLTFAPELVGDRPDLFVIAHRDDLTQEVTFIHPDSVDGTLVTVSATSFSTFQPVMFTELMTGVVLDRDTNQPIDGAEVFFYGSGTGTVTTDALGIYSFTIEDISSFGGGLSGELYIGTDGYFQAPAITVSDLGTQPTLPFVGDATLQASAPLITGSVTDAVSGSPIVGADVHFTRNPMSLFRGGGTTVGVTTDANGEYAVDASFFTESSGDFTVNFDVDAPGHLGASHSVTFSSGPITHDFVLNSSAGDLISGVVRDRNTNNPIPGAEVFFYGNGTGSTTTDANGVYTFVISDLATFGGALSGTVYIGTDGYFQAPPITVPDLGTEPSLPFNADATLLPSGALVTGIVTDAVSSLPIAGVDVKFTRSPPSTFRGGGTTVQVTTDANGAYAIDPSFFAETNQDLSVNFLVDVDGYLGVASHLTFATGPMTQDFALNSSAGTLMTGVVRDRNTNNPIPGAEVFFYGSGTGNVVADSNGVYAFTIDDLRTFGGGFSGTLYIGTDGYFQAPLVTVDELGTQPSLPVVADVTLLASGPLVTGRVTDVDTGLPLAGATVNFNRTPMSTFRGGGTTVGVSTDANGDYAIDASFFAENPSGDFSVHLMVGASGYLGATRDTNFNGGPVVEDVELKSGLGP